MRDDPSVTALRAMVRQSIIDDTPQTFMASLAKESDRGAVILAVTLLEDALLSAVTQKTGRTPKDGNLGSCLRSAERLGLVSPELASLIDHAREVRNACAHSRADIGFHTPELRAVVVRMFPGPGSEPPETWTAAKMRTLFVMTCVTTSRLVDIGPKPTPAQLFEQIGNNPVTRAMSDLFLRDLRNWG